MNKLALETLVFKMFCFGRAVLRWNPGPHTPRKHLPLSYTPRSYNTGLRRTPTILCDQSNLSLWRQTLRIQGGKPIMVPGSKQGTKSQQGWDKLFVWALEATPRAGSLCPSLALAPWRFPCHRDSDRGPSNKTSYPSCLPR